MKFGLIGRSLGHSFSKSYFSKKFEGTTDTYVTVELEPDELAAFLATTELDGFNVTIPYKQDIIPLLDTLSPEAQQVGAVNCVKKTPNGWLGHNTDVIGFWESIKELDLKNKKMLILGNGGAAKAVVAVCHVHKIAHKIVSRQQHPETLLYSELDESTLKENRIITNTTPLGMYPNLDTFPPIEYKHLGSDHICLDLVYNPTETLFIKKAKAQGAKTKNGLAMLYAQAEASYQYWL